MMETKVTEFAILVVKKDIKPTNVHKLKVILLGTNLLIRTLRKVLDLNFFILYKLFLIFLNN